jgi:glycosyltransferase involved in cell wall biosynthesis
MAHGEKIKILIGFLSNDKAESVSGITRVFIDGLGSRFDFIPLHADRNAGKTGQSRFNLVNGYYFVKHLLLWIMLLVRHRPAIAHYPVTSYWNLEKSLAFLRVARWFGARTIGHLHGGAFIEFWQTLSPVRKKLAAAEFRRMSGFIALSRGWRKNLIAASVIDEEKIFVVANPIDPVFEKSCLAMPVARGGNSMLALGVMDRQKGVFDLIEAASLVRERLRYPILLVGPERQPGIYRQIRTELDRRGLADIIRIRPGVWGSDKTALFCGARVLLLPSYRENLPVVVIEAAAAGIPSIVSPVGAVPEYFSHEESALFVNPGDIEGLAGALVQMTENNEKRERLGNAARALFLKRLKRESALESLQRVYESILSPPAAEPGRCTAAVD